MGDSGHVELGERALWQSRQREELSEVVQWERKGAGKIPSTNIIPMPEIAPCLSPGKASFLRFLL